MIPKCIFFQTISPISNHVEVKQRKMRFITSSLRGGCVLSIFPDIFSILWVNSCGRHTYGLTVFILFCFTQYFIDCSAV